MEAPTGYITREYFDLIINGLQKQIGGSSLNVIVNGSFSPDFIDGGLKVCHFTTGFASVLNTDVVQVTLKDLVNAPPAVADFVASCSNGSVEVTMLTNTADLADVFYITVLRS